MRPFSTFFLRSSLCAILLFGAALRAQPVDARITISDLLSTSLRVPLEEMAQEEGLNLAIRGMGTLPALDMLEAGEIDLAIIAHPTTARPLDPAYRMVPFAYEVVSVIAHRNNTLNDLTLRQIAGMFGSNEELNLTQWRELGIADLAGRSINLVAVDAPRSMALELFRYNVLTSRQLRPGVTLMRPREFEAYIANNQNAIGLLNRAPRDERLKMIGVSIERGAPAFTPTAENAFFEDYPIRLPFLIVYPVRASERVAPVLRILMGNRMAEAIEERELLAVPEAARQTVLLEMRRAGQAGIN